MAERHHQLLKAISKIAQQLFRAPDWQGVMPDMLRSLGESMRVSRAYLFQCSHVDTPECKSSILFEWVDDDISPQINNPELQGFSWKANNLLAWKDELINGRSVSACIDKLPDHVQGHFARQHIKSLLLVPVMTETHPWGFLGIDDCNEERGWSEEETETLNAVANILGAAIFRHRAERIMRDANERFHLAEKAGGIGSWDWNIQTGQLVWSENIEGMFGFSAGQFKKTYEAFLGCVHPEDRPGLEQAVRDTLEAGADYHYQHRIIWPDGSTHWVLETGEVTRDSSGKPVRMVGVVQDISDAVLMNKALKNSEQRFRDLVESTSDWIWEVDTQGRYTYASPKVEDILGYKPDEIIGKTPFDLMPPDEAERVTEIFRDIVANNIPFSQLVNTNHHRNGSDVILETSGVPLYSSTGEIIGYRGIDRDISARVASDRALRESQEIFKQLAEHVSEVFYVRDISGAIIYLSPSFYRFFGRDVDSRKWSLDDFKQLLHPDDKDMMLALIEGQYQGEGLDREFRIILPGDVLKWVWLRTFPIKNEDGVVYRIAGLVEDITSRKAAQDMRLQREIAHKETLVQEVHHRIKNNLQSIIGLLRLQLDEYPELADVLNRVVGQVQSIALIHGLQGRSRDMYLCEIVHAIGESNRKLCANDDLIEMQINNACPVVIREEDMVPIALIVNEVLMNAIKHGRQEQGGVKIEFSSDGQNAEIMVMNTTTESAVINEIVESSKGVGLGMIQVLMPREGASIHFNRENDQFNVRLVFTHPVVTKNSQGADAPQLGRLIL